MIGANTALVAAANGAFDTAGMPGPALLAGGLGLILGGICIGMAIVGWDRRDHTLEVVEEPALPSNVTVLRDVTGDDQFAPDVETHMQQAVAVANGPEAVQPVLRAVPSVAGGGS